MNAQPLIDYLSRYIILTSEEETLFLSKVRFRKYLKGQYVVQQGDVCHYESFVISGCLKTFYIDHEGHEHIVMFAVEDWWTADLGSFLSQKPASYNVQCLEKCELAQISYHDLEALYLAIPKFERFFRIIIQKAFVASQQRIIDSFSLPAKERYLKFRQQYPQIDQRVPQYMIYDSLLSRFYQGISE